MERVARWLPGMRQLGSYRRQWLANYLVARVTGVVLIIRIIVLIPGLFRNLPDPALAAVVITAALSLADIGGKRNPSASGLRGQQCHRHWMEEAARGQDQRCPGSATGGS